MAQIRRMWSVLSRPDSGQSRRRWWHGHGFTGGAISSRQTITPFTAQCGTCFFVVIRYIFVLAKTINVVGNNGILFNLKDRRPQG